MRLILVGPSHIPRIRHALEVVRLPRPIDEILYLGDGGFPIWKKSVFEQCCEAHRSGDKILLIVADFRFGNGILTDENCENIEDTVFFDNHTHVKRDLCTVEHDQKMKNLCIKALLKWKNRFGDNLIVLHWTLAMRTVKNRLLRQHINAHGQYRHPMWNIDDPEFLSDVPGLSTLQHTTELGLCNALTIDNDLHPSTLGYLYIVANSVFQNHEKSLNIAKTIYMAGINSLSASLSAQPRKKHIIGGPSKFISHLLTTLPLGTRAGLEKAGIKILPQGEISSGLLDDQDIQRLVYVSDRSFQDQAGLEEARLEILKNLNFVKDTDVSILFWDAIATQVMQWRARESRNAATGLVEKNVAARSFQVFWAGELSKFSFNDTDRLVEFGAGGTPTFWGIAFVLASAVSSNPLGIANSVMKSMEIAAKENALAITQNDPIQAFKDL